jgi:hypothetical protein
MPPWSGVASAVPATAEVLYRVLRCPAVPSSRRAGRGTGWFATIRWFNELISHSCMLANNPARENVTISMRGPRIF